MRKGKVGIFQYMVRDGDLLLISYSCGHNTLVTDEQIKNKCKSCLKILKKKE